MVEENIKKRAEPSSLPVDQCPSNSLNSAPHWSFLRDSSTKASNFGALPALSILLRAAAARMVLLRNSAARSMSCFTVSLVTAAPRIVASRAGVSSSRRCARARDVVGDADSRARSMCPITLISSDGSLMAASKCDRNMDRSSLVRQVSS